MIDWNKPIRHSVTKAPATIVSVDNNGDVEVQTLWLNYDGNPSSVEESWWVGPNENYPACFSEFGALENYTPEHKCTVILGRIGDDNETFTFYVEAEKVEEAINKALDETYYSYYSGMYASSSEMRNKGFEVYAVLADFCEVLY